jgi:hypothetical protein
MGGAVYHTVTRLLAVLPCWVPPCSNPLMVVMMLVYVYHILNWVSSEPVTNIWEISVYTWVYMYMDGIYKCMNVYVVTEAGRVT